MPTFQFYKERKLVHTVKGADATKLRDGIVAYSGQHLAHSVQHPSTVL